MTKTTAKLTRSEIIDELARRDFSFFIKQTFPNFKFSAFSVSVCEALQTFLDDVVAGNRPILIIEAPPQHGKSELASRRFPAFAFGRYRDLRIAASSYSADLASAMNKDVQRIMSSDVYKRIFKTRIGEKIVGGKALLNAEKFEVSNGTGYYVSCGVGGSLTGKAVDIGIIDDPIKNMTEARSQTVRATIESWYKTVFLTRLSKRSGQLIMMTRWHLEDLVGYIRKTADPSRVKVLSFKAIDEDGRPLVPDLHPLEQLEEMRATMSPTEWAALYQQSPIVEGGNLIKTENFQRYTVAPERFEHSFIVADTAFSDKKKADGSAFLHVGVVGGNVYLLNGYWKQVGFPQLRRDMKSFYLAAMERCPNLSGVYVENKGSGISLIQQLRDEGLPVVELYPTVKNSTLKKEQTADKYTRFLEVSAELESRRCFIPESAPWLLEFLTQCEGFTGGNQETKDDYCDALIYAIKTARKGIEIDWRKVEYELFS